MDAMMTAKADVWVSRSLVDQYSRAVRTTERTCCAGPTRGSHPKLYARSQRGRPVSLCHRSSYNVTDEPGSVLRKGGFFLYLTFGQPHFRRRYLTRLDTTLETRQLGEAFHYYLYILKT